VREIDGSAALGVGGLERSFAVEPGVLTAEVPE
jgi:hypothetical protein